MNKGLTIAGIIMMALAMGLNISHAQEVAQPTPTTPPADAVAAIEDEASEEGAEEGDFAYGTVVSVASNQITVSEYNYDTDQETQVSYAIDTNTKYENVALASELKAGDEVEINYKDDNGKKTALMIYKFSSWDEMEDEEAFGDEEGASDETSDAMTNPAMNQEMPQTK